MNAIEPAILIDRDGASGSVARRDLRSGFIRRAVFRILTGNTAPMFDSAKLWDVLNVERLLSGMDRSRRILDCGGFNSPCLRALERRGFRHVHAIDLNPAIAAQDPFGSSHLTVQDMQASAFRSGAFDVVLSCSTMEHGVSWPLFLAEAARLLRPGGLLYVSTDLVDDDADPSWVEAFGLPWQPLRVADVGTIVESLDSNGFRAPAPLDIDLPETLPHEFFGVPLAFIALVATKHP